MGMPSSIGSPTITDASKASRSVPGEARRNSSCAARESAAQGEGFDAILADVEKLMPASPTGSRQISMPISAATPRDRRSWAIYCLRLGRSGHALVDEPCLYRSRNTDDGLAGWNAGLPKKFLSTSAGGGVIQDTASSASLAALSPVANTPPLRDQSARL